MTKPKLIHFRKILNIAINISLISVLLYTAHQYSGLAYTSTKVDTPVQARAIMYATKWCRYCIQARGFFAKNNIPYYEYNIDTSNKSYHEFKRLGGQAVPLIVVGNTIIHGLQRKKLKQVLVLN